MEILRMVEQLEKAEINYVKVEVKDIDNNQHNDFIVIIQSLNDLPKVEEALKIGSFHREYLKEEALYKYNDPHTSIFVGVKENKKEFVIQKPDYSNGMLNIVSSIQKYYQEEYQYSSINELDEYLQKYQPKHLFFMILDGLADFFIQDYSVETSFFQENYVKTLSAVYPSTTSAAIPCALSGKAPKETGWLGWENYFKELKRDVILFQGTDYFTQENLGVNIQKDYLPYNVFYHKFNVKTRELQPSFAPNGFHRLDNLLKEMVKISKQNEDTFTYIYWDEPDATLHEYGCHHQKSLDKIKELNQQLELATQQLTRDSLLIITADHGHLDVEEICLLLFSKIMQLLDRMPSNEGRCTFFSVKRGKKEEFKSIFNFYFGNYFHLMSKEDFIDAEYIGLKNIGKLNERISDFIGDYVAIATSKYYFKYDKQPFIFKSHHAGLTQMEMQTPLIIFVKKED